MRRYAVFQFLAFVSLAPFAYAGAGEIKGIVRDSQHSAVVWADVKLQSRTSDFSAKTMTADDGSFSFRGLPDGEYTVSIVHPGFNRFIEKVNVTAGNTPSLDIQLSVAGVSESLAVTAKSDEAQSRSVTPTTLVDRNDIAITPGADRTNSLSMITDFTPGAYMVHDQLHIRGGHQTGWLIDGIPIPNTNIASNVGPQFDPKDIDVLEVERGSYPAQDGDRTYGIFNIIPRTGFERQNEGEFVISYGNFNQTNDQFSIGSHSDRFAYYLSANGNRSGYGLEPPTAAVLHDRANGAGGFASLIFLPDDQDQLRLFAGYRHDHYQVPNDPASEAAGISDVEVESDGFLNFSWVRLLSSGLTLTISPFYHRNTTQVDGGPFDTPVIANENRSSQYAGAQIQLSEISHSHSASAGFYGFFQRDSAFFGLTTPGPGGAAVQDSENPNGNLDVVFAQDQYKPGRWITLTGGIRLTHYAGALSENAANPRAGLSIRIPHTPIVLHGFFGEYYQAPPLSTVAGPVLDLAISEGFGFLPLKGERDQEYQTGASANVRGWKLDADYFHTLARNFFDHNPLGESNVFFPVTIDSAFIRGVEITIRSPRIARRLDFHAAYSHQHARAEGNVNGGLTNFSPPSPVFDLDHDQRDTLSTGIDIELPRRAFLSSSIRYGSGFTDNGGPAHLPGHTVGDLSAGKSLGESWSLAVHVLNVTGARFLLDNSLTFGGTHFSDPRQVYGEVRFRFHY